MLVKDMGLKDRICRSAQLPVLMGSTTRNRRIWTFGGALGWLEVFGHLTEPDRTKPQPLDADVVKSYIRTYTECVQIAGTRCTSPLSPSTINARKPPEARQCDPH